MAQAIQMVKYQVATGIDSTVACIRVANELGLSVQTVINAYMWS